MMNEIWEGHKSANNELTLLGQLDYMRKLSTQRNATQRNATQRNATQRNATQRNATQRNANYTRLLYAASGRPTAAVVQDPDVVIHFTLYWIPIRSPLEGDYLAAVINSTALWQALVPLTPRNWAGNSRHVVKHLWRLPIPEYDEADPLHREIAEAGAAAAGGAAKVLEELPARRAAERKSTTITSTIARREIRAWLAESAEGRAVEEAVGRLLAGG